jgi:hypothetical protein
MSTVTVPRTDLTTETVTAALRDGLSDRYNVLPGMAIGRMTIQAPRKGQPNMITVGTGENLIVKAQVTIVPRDGHTDLRIRPGGITLDLLLNTLGVARKVRRVLKNSPGLAAR